MSVGRFKWALLFFFVAYTLNFLSVFRTTPEQQSQYSDCEYLTLHGEQLFGSEDGVLYDEDTLIFTQANLHKVFKGPEAIEEIARGKFFAVSGIVTHKLVVKPIRVKNDQASVFFFPHGIYLQKDLLRVVNHSMYSGGERVDTYKVAKDAKTGEITVEFLHATIMDENLNGIANDLVFVSATRFIITDWMVFSAPQNGAVNQPAWKKLATMASWMLGIRATHTWDCIYVENSKAKCEKVPDGSGGMMNGIAFDGDKTIITADTINRELRVFKLEGDSIKLVQKIATTQLPDNITYDAKSKVFYVGGTNSVLEYLMLTPKTQAVQSNPNKTANVSYQAIVEKVKWNDKSGLYEVHPVFASSNTVVGLAGAFTAASDYYLFMFSFIDKAPMVCTKVATRATSGEA